MAFKILRTLRLDLIIRSRFWQKATFLSCAIRNGRCAACNGNTLAKWREFGLLLLILPFAWPIDYLLLFIAYSDRLVFIIDHESLC